MPNVLTVTVAAGANDRTDMMLTFWYWFQFTSVNVRLQADNA